MIRRLDSERLENILLAFYRPLDSPTTPVTIATRLFRKPDQPTNTPGRRSDD
jgi:hypothetical protein